MIFFEQPTIKKSVLLTLILEKATELLNSKTLTLFCIDLQSFIDSLKLTNYLQPKDIFILQRHPNRIELFKRDGKGDLVFVTSFKETEATPKTEVLISENKNDLSTPKKAKLIRFTINSDELLSKYPLISPFINDGKILDTISLHTNVFGDLSCSWCDKTIESKEYPHGNYKEFILKHNGSETFYVYCPECANGLNLPLFKWPKNTNETTPKKEVKSSDFKIYTLNDFAYGKVDLKCFSCEQKATVDVDLKNLTGFFDADLNVYVHRYDECKNQFYDYKNSTNFANMYSEVPIPIASAHIFIDKINKAVTATPKKEVLAMELNFEQIEKFFNTHINNIFSKEEPFFKDGKYLDVKSFEFCSTASDGSKLNCKCEDCEKEITANLGGYFQAWLRHDGGNNENKFGVLCNDCAKSAYYIKFDRIKQNNQDNTIFNLNTEKTISIIEHKLNWSKIESQIIAKAQQLLYYTSLTIFQNNLQDGINSLKQSNHVKASHTYKLEIIENELILFHVGLSTNKKTKVASFKMINNAKNNDVKPIEKTPIIETTTPILELKPKKQIAIKPSELPPVKAILKNNSKSINDTYAGGKNASGVYQFLINHVPPVKCIVSGFLGHCALLKNIKPANLMVGIDKDVLVTDRWNKENTSVKLITGDFLLNLVWVNPKQFGETLVFLDPPYLNETRANQGKLYNHEFETLEQHKTLLEKAIKFPCYVMIIAYENELYNQYLDGKNGFTKHYFNSQTRGGRKQECMYINYEVPTKLHDYKYYGTDYRERWNNKKLIDRTISQLKDMPPLRRNMVIDAILNQQF